MTNYKRICTVLICCMTIFNIVWAQKEIPETNTLALLQNSPIPYQELSLNEMQLQAGNTGAPGSKNSLVFIQQIGSDNNINTRIRAQNSDIKLIQYGHENKIEINEASKEINKLIIQNGDQNRVSDISFNSDISTNLELIQDGDQLTFERFGSNELTKNLKFSMSGCAKTIIVRSF